MCARRRMSRSNFPRQSLSSLNVFRIASPITFPVLLSTIDMAHLELVIGELAVAVASLVQWDPGSL
jgi:hypothetical protein